MDDSIFPNILVEKFSKIAWDILKTNYQDITKVTIINLWTLRMNFGNLKMKESELIDQFMTQVMNIVSQLRMNGEELLDQKVVEEVLRTLPKKLDVVVLVIEEFKDLTQLSVNELLGYFLSHESRMNRNDDSELENYFKSKVSISRGRGRSRSRGRGGSNTSSGQRDGKEDSE